MSAASELFQAHGKIKEVLFVKGPFHAKSILVFDDGNEIRVGWNTSFPQLTFGYAGAGTSNFKAFLSEAGFPFTDVESVQSPLIVKADGTRVKGVVKDNQVEWEDGMKSTPLWT